MTGANQEDNARAELRRAEQALVEAEALVGLKMGNGAASRAYCAAFHTAAAVLIRLGQQARTHRGLHSLFETHVVVPGLLAREHLQRLARLEERRGVADYRVDLEIPLDQARGLVDDARALLSAGRALLDTWPAGR